MLKKLILPILILIIFLLPSLCFSGALEMDEAVIARKNVAGGSCTESTPGNDNSEVGILAEGANNTVTSDDYVYCTLNVADCSGTLGTAYTYSRSDDATRPQKVAVYSTTDTDEATVPTNGTLVGASGAIDVLNAAQTWYSSEIGSGSVAAASKYWVCVFTNNSNGPYNYFGDGQSRHYQDVEASGYYASPPASLPTSGWSTIADRKASVFVGIK